MVLLLQLLCERHNTCSDVDVVSQEIFTKFANDIAWQELLVRKREMFPPLPYSGCKDIGRLGVTRSAAQTGRTVCLGA